MFHVYHLIGFTFTLFTIGNNWVIVCFFYFIFKYYVSESQKINDGHGSMYLNPIERKDFNVSYKHAHIIYNAVLNLHGLLRQTRTNMKTSFSVLYNNNLVV